MKQKPKISKLASFWMRLKLKLAGEPNAVRNVIKYRARGVSVGEGTYIYTNVHIGTSKVDDITIGSNCVLTGCTILGHDASIKKHLGHVIAKPVVIEDDCFIGFNATVLHGVTIGKGSIVGAGSVVTKDVPPGTIVVGNPAKVICTVEDFVNKYN